MTAEQLDVFGGSVPLASAPRSRLSDPDTSVQAGKAVDLNKRCAEVLINILGLVGLAGDRPFTDGALARHMLEDRNIVARRRKDLADLGLVEAVRNEHGEQIQQMGRRRRFEFVWQLTDRGRTLASTLTQEVPPT